MLYGDKADFSMCTGNLRFSIQNSGSNSTFNIECFATHPNLVYFDLHNCSHVVGSIEAFANCSKLEEISVSLIANKSQVYGDISSLTNLNLRYLAVDFTNVTGSINSFASCTNLKWLSVNNTNKPGKYSYMGLLSYR